MADAIVICGHGPGISDAVARRFGKEGFSVALAARSADRLEAAARALGDAGIRAKAFPTNLGDPDAVRALVRGAREALGPIAVLHWNAYQAGAGDLLASSVADLRAVFDVAVSGLLVAVQEALGDLEQQKGALLVTGGGFALYNPAVDAMAVQYQAMGLAVSKAAQHKVVGLLHERLAKQGVYVGEVVVMGMVKGTAFDSGAATIEPGAIAERFWQLHQNRSEASVEIA
jgi:NADP-dependent 3-hydroxy acid dehydrogenase YdfG